MNMKLRHEMVIEDSLWQLRRIERDLDPEATATPKGSYDLGGKVGFALFAASMVVAMIFFVIGLLFVPLIFLIFVSFIIWYVGGLVVAAMNVIGLVFSLVGIAFSFRSTPALLGNLGSLFLNSMVVGIAGYLYRHLFV